MTEQVAPGHAEGVRRQSGPRMAAYLVTATLALAFSYDLMRKPIQIPDSLIDILHMQESPSVYTTFRDSVAQRAYLRPLRIAQVKALFDLADGHYWLVFRGFHALLVVGVLLLFTRAMRIQSWVDFSAAIFALMVLTGMHTFRGIVREAFPINHFAEILLFCLLTLNLAQSRGGWWVDLGAAVTFVAATLTLESGLLVWVVAVAAWFGGMRGISNRGVAAMTVLLASYFVVRFLYLSTGAPGLEERTAGVWITMMTPAELIQRFGDNPTWFYLYNVVASVLSVLFAEPERGVFLMAQAWIVDGEMPARVYLSTVPTTATTILIGWTIIARLRGRAPLMPRLSDQFLLLFVAILLSNAALSFAYTKHEIVSVAGAFYALAAFAAARHAIDRLGERRAWMPQMALCVALAVLSSVWAFRSVGVHHVIQVQAFKEQLQWARLDTTRLAEREYPSDARAQALAESLRRDALALRIPNPHLLPAWPDMWWGE